MNTQPKEIEYYQTQKGGCPFRDWFAALKDQAAQMRIDARLARLRGGNPGDVKAVGSGVSELRIDYGPGYREANANRRHQTGKEIPGGLPTTQAT